MQDCGQIRRELTAYLEGVIDGEEAERIRAHLDGCPACRGELEEQRAFIAFLRERLTPPTAPPGLEVKIRRRMAKERARQKRSPWRIPVAAAAAVVLLITAWLHLRPDQGWAVEAHRELSARPVMLEMKSSDPTALSRWFEGKVDGSFSIPENLPGRLALRGGRRVDYRGIRVAQILYETEAGTASLFLLPRDRLKPGGRPIDFGGIRFYETTEEGHFLLAWTGKTVSYILVSVHPEAARSGCLLCHGHGQISLPLSGFYEQL